MISIIIKILLAGFFVGILVSIFSPVKSANGELTRRSIGSIFARCFFIFMVFFMALIAWPDFSHPSRNPRKMCNANQWVIAESLEKYYAKNGTAQDPINLSNGKIDLGLLVEKGFLRAPIESFPECIYVGYPYASGAVEVFCLFCGFNEQEKPTIHEEFDKRFALASPTASIMTVNFSAAPDFSQVDSQTYLDRNRTALGRFAMLRELFGVSKFKTEKKY